MHIQFKTISFLVIALIFFSFNLYANKEIERLALQGLEHTFHFRWEKAEETFSSLIEKHPDHPAGYHFMSGVYLWYYLGSKDIRYLDIFNRYSDDAIKHGGEMLKSNKGDSDVNYFLGANYNYRAIAHAQEGNYLDAALASKRAESYLSTTLELDKNYFDAYLGLGLYNIAVSQIPAGFRWVLKIAGISGDADTGVQYIKLAASKGKYAKTEAQYYLSHILMGMFADNKSALSYLKSLSSKYPANIVFNYALAVVEIKERNLSSAEKILNKIITADDVRFIQVISFSHFLLGDIYFRRNDFETAIEYYNRFLETAPDKDYTGIASYRLAVSYEILADRQTAEKYFNLASKGNLDIEDDVYADRKGKEYIKRNMSELEIEIIKANNLIENKKYQDAIDTLTSLIENITSNELKSQAFLYLAEAYYETKLFAESLRAALNAVELNASGERWIKPFAYYFAAKASNKLGDLKSALYYKELSEKMNEYDYKNKLRGYLNALKIDEQS